MGKHEKADAKDAGMRYLQANVWACEVHVASMLVKLCHLSLLVLKMVFRHHDDYTDHAQFHS